jgi:hypothetical protein
MSPLSAIAGNPFKGLQSSMPKMGGVGTARMRMPHITIADTLHNIGQSMKPAKSKLAALKAKGGRTRYDVGGEVKLGAAAINALKTALSHLRNRDASSAAAVLRGNPQAIAHPAVAQAAQGLRASTGIAPATKSLTDLVNAHTDSELMPTFRRGGRSSAGR